MPRSSAVNPRRGPTLRDVAAAAEVSVATASYVLNGKRLERITPATRRKVEESARRLHYTPNATARSLVMRRSQKIGIFIPRPLDAALRDACTASLVRGIIQSSVLHDYAIELAVEGSDLARHGVDGWISCYASTPMPEGPTRGAPVVYIDPRFTDDDVIAVRPDFVQAGRALADHWRDHVSEVCFLLARPEAQSSPQVLAGVEALAASLGDDVRFHRVAPSSTLWDIRRIVAAWLDHLEHKPWPAALVAEDDEMALHLLNALRTRGVQIPAQLQLAAFNETGFARLGVPAITAVDLRTEEIGYRAAYRLLHELNAAATDPAINLDGSPVPQLQAGETTRGHAPVPWVRPRRRPARRE